MKISFTNVLKVSFTFLFALCVSGVFAQTVLRINDTDLAGDYSDVGVASFGPQEVGSLTGDLALAEDGDTFNPNTMDNTGSVTDCCQPITNGNDIAGKIAVIDRGVCFFSDKVQNAEAVGAIAVVICNNAAGDGPVAMGPPDNFVDDIGIYTISLSLEFCDQIKAEMANNTVNVTITDQVNMALSSISYSKQTPLSQVLPLNVTFGHTNRVEVPQENVHLTCEITDPAGAVTVIDTMIASVDTLPPGFFHLTTTSTQYTPTMVGEYTARFYNNGANMTNYIEGIDEEEASFTIVEEDVFKQDDGSAPLPIVNNSSPNNWGMANIYTIANRTEALSVSFALANPENIVNENIDLILYKLDPNGDGNIDEDNDGMFGGLTSAELDLANIISNQSHTISADDVPNELITLDLLPFNNDGILEGTPENPGYYMLVLEYTTGGPTDTLTISSTDNNDRQSTPLVIADPTGIPTASIGGSMAKGGNDWESLNGVFQPLIHLHVSPPLVNVNQPELENHEVSLMPNPTSENVQVVFDLPESSDAVEVSLFNLTGQVISSEIHNNLYKDTLTMDVSQLPSGVYFVHVSTTKGRKTLRLVVK